MSTSIALEPRPPAPTGEADQASRGEHTPHTRRALRALQHIARRRRLRTVVVFVMTLAVTAIVMLPIAVIVLTAFKPTGEVNAYPPHLIPHQWTLSNFTQIFTDLPFAQLIANSFMFAGGVTLCSLLFDSLTAYALARLDFRGSRVLLIGIVASLMIPFQATLIPVYHLVAAMGLVNTFLGMILPRACDAFGIFFLRQSFLALPRDLDSAARLDGAGEFRIFRSVVLPNAVPAMLTLAVYTFVNNWNDLLWPLVFTTQTSMGTITSGLTVLTGSAGIVPYGVMMAGSLLAIAPLAVIYLLVQRRFIESIASTGMK